MLAFIAAESREFTGLLKNAELVSKLDWHVRFARMAVLRGNTILLAANGPGPKLAAQAVDVVHERAQVDGLVSIGFCGALAPALAPCDIFVATEVLGAGAVSRPADSMRPFKTGKLLSIDRVASTAAEKSELRKTGADAVEMEAGAVAERAEHWNLPFYVIRVVTDAADESLPLDFNRLAKADKNLDYGKLAWAIAKAPGKIGALLELQKKTRFAAERLAAVLDRVIPNNNGVS